MRLAYVVSLFPKLSETFILREILELKRRGHEVTVFSLRADREPLEHEEAGPLRSSTVYPRYGSGMLLAWAACLSRRPLALLHIMARVAAAHAGRPGLLARSLATVPAAVWFSQEARRRGVQHVHAHWATHPALAAWIVSRLNRVPYSVTGHAHDLFLPNPMLPSKVGDSSFFATISEFNRSLLIQLCGPGVLDKLKLIRCGLPLDRFPPAARHATVEPGRPASILSVGRLVDYKGFDVLIRACGRLRDSGRPFRCRIVGDGPQRDELASLIGSLRLDSLVTLEGPKRQGEVASLMAESDLFVLACVAGRDGLHDGIPIVLMEAMALGVPVVSTRLSGIPELVEDRATGLLVAPGDDAHLAAAMQLLLSDATLAEDLRRSGREKVEREFDLKRSVDQLEAAFARAGAGSAGP